MPQPTESTHHSAASAEAINALDHNLAYIETPKRAAWKSWLFFIVIAALMIAGNSQLQVFLGKRAQDKLKYPVLSFEQALASAKSNKKLVLADMSAIWCPSCRKLESEVLANPQVYDAVTKRYIFVRVEYETEQGKAIMANYDVSGFPTLLVIDPRGNTLRRLPITFDPQEFITLIQY